MIKIPDQNKRYSQTNYSDTLGNLWSTLGIDLSTNVGTMLAAGRGLITSKSNDTGLDDMETPVAFAMFKVGNDTHIWMISGDFMWKNNGDPNDPFVKDDLDDSPTDLNTDSDMAIFNGALYVCNGTTIYKLDNGGTWTTVSTTPTGGNCQMCVYGGKLYFTFGGSRIGYVALDDSVGIPSGTPNTVSFTLNLTDYGSGGSLANNITSIRASSNRIYITTNDITSQGNSAGRTGHVFEWDGESPIVTKVTDIDSVGAMALVIKGDIPYIMDADGRLRQYTGSDFQEVARLPLMPYQYLRNPNNGNTTERFIHPRGMIVRNGRILVLINNVREDSGNTILENLPSGVWEFDDKVGLYHKYSPSYWQYSETTTRTDYAQNRIQEVGALFNAKSTSDSSNLNGDIMFGISYYPNATTTNIYGVFINDTRQEVQTVAYYVSTKIDSQNVRDVWQKLFIVYRKFSDEADKISVKYRTSEQPPVEATITWVSETEFTTTDDISGYVVGDEVEIVQGTGGGQIEHIESIDVDAGTYTVLLPNAVTGATGTSIARFQKWIPIGTTQDLSEEYLECAIGTKSAWIQIKVVGYFTGIGEINTLQLVNQTFDPSK